METIKSPIIHWQNFAVVWARACYGAAREKNAQLREALSAANTVMAENMTQMMAMALMFDLMADGNPALMEMWRAVRLNINPNRTLKEQAELERQTERRSSELRDDLNL
ncbi:hypothetical protein F2Q70_00041416 [Brassica cretica]|uniref:Uncharacterized protein n=1 Tax=Brassica cretica TaxID=69181 RepID=A0A8S9K2J1_BRACR|nr:hypothetical protein F2Q70_00041416 [Brassica cretica]